MQKKTRANIVLLVTTGSCSFVLFSYFTILKFPWQTITSEFGQAKSSRFMSPWPLGALEEEKQERKKSKRYAKQEQIRRMGIQLRKMEFLNVPLFDLFLDSGVQVDAPSRTAPVALKTHIAWPSMNTLRVVGEENKLRPVSYVVIPSENGSEIREGMLLSAGDELRFPYPVVKNRRTIHFNILPLTPGTLRGFIGPHSWVKTFNEQDIHKLQTISIPINDPTATNARFIAVSANLFLLNAQVSQSDKSGRIPIQISNESKIWQAKPERLTMPMTQSNDTTDLEIEELESNDKEPAKETSIPEIKYTPTNKAPEQLPQTTVTLDNMEERENSQILSSSKTTTALGYNLLLLQLDTIPEAIFTNEKLFAKLAPNLAALLKNSFAVVSKLKLPALQDELFRKTILGNVLQSESGKSLPTLQQTIENTKQDNLYLRFRNYGYRSVAVAPPSVLGLRNELSYGKDIPKLDGRWLDSNDWKFAERRRELDDQNEPVSGLDAIFQTRNAPLAAPLTDADYQNFSKFLKAVVENEISLPDWRANEIFLPDGRDLYFGRTLNWFQKWTRENLQTRFLCHMSLDLSTSEHKPTLKDLAKVIKSEKLSLLTSQSNIETYAKIALLDRTVGQIFDALTARRLEHRTVVGIIAPHGQRPSGTPFGSFILKIPGLLARPNAIKEDVRLEDFMATLATSVGVPFANNIKDSVQPYAGKMLEIPALSAELQTGTPQEKSEIQIQLPEKSSRKLNIKRYNISIKVAPEACEPFDWRTPFPIFGIESNQPIYEFRAAAVNRLRIYPCALPTQFVHLHWYQNETNPWAATEEGPLLARNPNLLGGYFELKSKIVSQKSAPLFLFGRKSASLNSIPLFLQKISTSELENLIDYPLEGKEKEIEKTLEFLARATNPSKANRTLVHFSSASATR